MVFVIPPLPFGYDGLVKKGISKDQVTVHYDNHHQGYVKKLNAAVENNPELGKKSIYEIIKTEKGPIFNLAGQIFNHTFYWNCMSPTGGGQPKGALLDAINAAFGSMEAFKKEFTTMATAHFGSGWAWLVQDPKSGSVKLHQTHDAGTPQTEDLKPLLACDVWEHAYYIDYRFDRPKYVETFWNCINWDFVESNFKGSAPEFQFKL